MNWARLARGEGGDVQMNVCVYSNKVYFWTKKEAYEL